MGIKLFLVDDTAVIGVKELRALLVLLNLLLNESISHIELDNLDHLVWSNLEFYLNL